MKSAVLVALLLVGLATYSLLRSAHDLGMSLMADTTHSAGAAAPRLLGDELQVTRGMATLALTCENTAGCRGVMEIELASGRTGSAPYALAGAQTTRLSLPLPAGAAAERATLTWREDTGATATAQVRLTRS